MKMVKQEPGSRECAACVVSMLTDRTREEILTAAPDYAVKVDGDWLNMLVNLGYLLQDPRDDPGFDNGKTCDGRVFTGHFNLPRGYRYYCTICSSNDAHTVAIDENGMVFDPSPSAPMSGTCTLEQYVRHNHKISGEVRIGCCYRVLIPGMRVSK
jgi:hypothetical protein